MNVMNNNSPRKNNLNKKLFMSSSVFLYNVINDSLDFFFAFMFTFVGGGGGRVQIVKSFLDHTSPLNVQPAAF